MKVPSELFTINEVFLRTGCQYQTIRILEMSDLKTSILTVLKDDELKRLLGRAEEDERYEDCALIRDEIRRREKRGANIQHICPVCGSKDCIGHGQRKRVTRA